MLKKQSHIEGLEYFEDVDSADDIDPTANLISFYVVSEEMPALTREAGRTISKNFVHIRKTINLGNLIVERRIRDTVEYDEKSNKWKILKLAKKSDIKQYPDEWNAFARSAVDNVIGTPLSVLFPNDPAKVDTYKYFSIKTVEQLSLLTDAHIQSLPLDARKDRQKAELFLKATEENAPSIAVQSKIEEKDRQIAFLTQTVESLKAEMTKFMELQSETKKPKKSKAEQVEI